MSLLQAPARKLLCSHRSGLTRRASPRSGQARSRRRFTRNDCTMRCVSWRVGEPGQVVDLRPHWTSPPTPPPPFPPQASPTLPPPAAMARVPRRLRARPSSEVRAAGGPCCLAEREGLGGGMVRSPGPRRGWGAALSYPLVITCSRTGGPIRVFQARQQLVPTVPTYRSPIGRHGRGSRAHRPLGIRHCSGSRRHRVARSARRPVAPSPPRRKLNPPPCTMTARTCEARPAPETYATGRSGGARLSRPRLHPQRTPTPPFIPSLRTAG